MSVLRYPATAVVVAAVLRLLLLSIAHSSPELQPVGQEAGNIAISMASGHGFATPLGGMQGPTAWLAPVYPFLLFLGFKFWHTDPSANVLFAQLLNCVFSSLTCWPIYLTGKKIFGERIGLGSCWLWAVLPTAVLFPLEWIWDQSLSALLLALLLCVTLYIRGSTRVWAWAGYGLLWAIALLTNPAVGILLPFLLVWLILQQRSSGAPWARPVGAAVLACVLAILPWTARNYSAFGQFVPIKSNFGLELWLGNNPEVKFIWTWWRSPASDVQQSAELHRLGELSYMQEKQREALQFIESHPAIFLGSCFDRFVDTWTAVWDSRVDPWVTALHAGAEYKAFTTLFSLLALAGLLLARRSYGAQIVPLSLSMLLFPTTYYITHSAVRYRHPIDPMMTLLAAYAIAYGWSRASAPSPATRPSTRQQKGAKVRRTAASARAPEN